MGGKIRRFRELTKYGSTRDAIGLGALIGGVLPLLYGFAIIFIPSLLVGLFQGPYIILTGIITGFIFGTFGGLVFGLIPVVVIGVITGGIVDLILALNFEKMTHRKAILVALLTSLVIAVIVNLILISQVFWWFRESQSWSLYFIFAGGPSLIYIIASGKTAHHLYLRKLETYTPLAAPAAYEDENRNNLSVAS